MKEFRRSNKLFYQFDQLRSDNLLHFTTTKVSWEGDGKTRFTGDTGTAHLDYRKELAAGLGIQQEQLVFPRQTHSNHIKIVTQPLNGAEITDTDALVTNVPGLCICVQTADCVPILLYDPEKKVTAAIHAGWRGTVNQLVSQTVQRLIAEFHCAPEDLIAGIGPSISQPNYEVGNDVIEAVKANFENHSELLSSNGKVGKAFFDLWKANQTQLEKSGVPSAQIEVMGLCSFNGDKEFYSARRDGAATGRMASGIMLR